MVDLQFDDFALMVDQVRKENQFRLLEVFSSIDVTILSRTRHSVSGFPAFLHNTDRPLFGDPRNVLHNEGHNEGEARNFNISTLRGRNRRLLAAVM